MSGAKSGTGGTPVDKNSSPHNLLREIENLRAEMYELAGGDLDPEIIAALQETSRVLDELVYRFMSQLHNEEWTEKPHE